MAGFRQEFHIKSSLKHVGLFDSANEVAIKWDSSMKNWDLRFLLYKASKFKLKACKTNSQMPPIIKAQQISGEVTETTVQVCLFYTKLI